jgi:fatty acid desaturase
VLSHGAGRQQFAKAAPPLVALLLLTAFLPACVPAIVLCTACPQAELAVIQASASYSFVLFQSQHVYEGAYRVPKADYQRGTAALQGSSCLMVPAWWEWATLGM